MRIVFDENVPWPLRKFLPDHDVTSVQREGFGGMENGELLAYSINLLTILPRGTSHHDALNRIRKPR